VTAIFDIETNGLYHQADTLHCISIKLIHDDEDKTSLGTEVYTAKPIGNTAGTLEQGLELLSKCDLIVGHNIVNFDIPTIQKLYPEWTYNKCLDTLIVSRLAYPNLMVQDAKRKTIPPKLKGSHSLKAWGYRLRKLKGEFGAEEEQWEVLTEEMIEYCRQDAEVTYHLYNKLLTLEVPDEAIWLEQEFAKIISRQEKYGCYFDMEKARKLHIELLQEADKAEEELYKTFKPLQDFVPTKKPSRYNKDGRESKTYINQVAKGCKDYPGLGWGYYKEVVFNPSSRQHIARWLSEVYDWKPTEYTEKGSVIINDGVLNSLEFPEGKILAHYFNVKKLLGQLAEGNNAWLKLVNEKTHRIHGRVNTLGAVSRRCTHSNPNMAQVPSNRAYKGHESRELFCVPKGKKLVGCDMSGLELRVFAHYLARFDGGEYAKVILTEDIHTYNQKAANLPTRDMAKTMIYGTLYGAGNQKIGEIVGGSENEGKKIKESFQRNVPAYAKLLQQIDKVYKNTKTLKALDGNPFHIRSSHSALNTLLQGAGALLCKVWLIETDQALQKVGYVPGSDYEFVLNVHDEFSNECNEEIAEEVARITEECCQKAGEFFDFRIKLEGEAKIGYNWYDVH
jgi:DNA polymerase-1